MCYPLISLLVGVFPRECTCREGGDFFPDPSLLTTHSRCSQGLPTQSVLGTGGPRMHKEGIRSGLSAGSSLRPLPFLRGHSAHGTDASQSPERAEGSALTLSWVSLVFKIPKGTSLPYAVKQNLGKALGDGARRATQNRRDREPSRVESRALEGAVGRRGRRAPFW